MHGDSALSGLDTVLLMAPFAVFLVLALFGMDERLSAASIRVSRRRKFCEVGRDGKGRLSDPDGRCGHGSGFPAFRGRSAGNFAYGAVILEGKRGKVCPANQAILLKCK